MVHSTNGASHATGLAPKMRCQIVPPNTFQPK
jgi:hypothetical protein